MRKQTKLITLGAVFTALSLVFVYLASVFPTGQVGIVALASLFGIAAVVETGLVGGVFVFAATSFLGFVLIPNKTVMVLYAVFLGYYPILKSLAERVKSRAIEWVIKLVSVNIAMTVIVFVFSELVFHAEFLNQHTVLLYLAVNVVFVIYDFGVSKLIEFYINRISKQIKR